MLTLKIRKILLDRRKAAKADLAGRQEQILTAIRKQMQTTRESEWGQAFRAKLPVTAQHNWTEEEIRKDDEACDRAISTAMKSFGEKVRAEHKEGLRKEINKLVAEFEAVEAKQ